MEKVSVGIRLPPGFRFHPTDEELVVEYLKRKAYSFPLPASIIPDLDVCKSDPWDLPGDSGQERYFFSRREAKYPNGNRSNRATLSGYWKATGKDKAILLRNNNNVVVVGMKKTLVFYRGKPPHGSRTDWIMHEYRLPHSSGPQAKADWVLCRIFLKKRNNSATRNIVEDEQEDQQEVICDDHNQVCTIINTDTNNGRRNVKPVFYDFLGAHLNHPAPSSDSSAVTQLSSNTNDDSESTSCCNTSSFNTAKPSHPPS